MFTLGNADTASTTLRDGSILHVTRGEAIDRDGRTVYSTALVVNGEDILHDEIRTGTYLDHEGARGPLGVLGSFCSFLYACAESWHRDGENANLYPPNVAEWAHQNSDEIGWAGHCAHEWADWCDAHAAAPSALTWPIFVASMTED